jgi:hypothetical protein
VEAERSPTRLVEFHARTATAVIGAIAATAISLLAWPSRCGARRSGRCELVAENFSVSLRHQALAEIGRVRGDLAGRPRQRALALLGFALITRPPSPAGAFFGAGGLLLISASPGSGSCWDDCRPGPREAVGGGARRRNAARRPDGAGDGRHAACGCFVVFSVSAMKGDLSTRRASGNRGREGSGSTPESSIVIPNDLNEGGAPRMPADRQGSAGRRLVLLPARP